MARPFCKRSSPFHLSYHLLLSVSTALTYFKPLPSLTETIQQLPNQFHASALVSAFHLHADARIIYLKHKSYCDSLLLGNIQGVLVGLRTWAQLFSGTHRFHTLSLCPSAISFPPSHAPSLSSSSLFIQHWTVCSPITAISTTGREKVFSLPYLT